ncbi:MAG: hypothetical protein V1901_03680 [Patescibacteria group bacterium]
MDNKYYCIDCKYEINKKARRCKSCANKNIWDVNSLSFPENLTHLLTMEISENNINARLKYGFELLQD